MGPSSPPRRHRGALSKPERSAVPSNFTHRASGLPGAAAFYDEATRISPELHEPEDQNITFTSARSADAPKLVDRVWIDFEK